MNWNERNDKHEQHEQVRHKRTRSIDITVTDQDRDGNALVVLCQRRGLNMKRSRILVMAVLAAGDGEAARASSSIGALGEGGEEGEGRRRRLVVALSAERSNPRDGVPPLLRQVGRLFSVLQAAPPGVRPHASPATEGWWVIPHLRHWAVGIGIRELPQPYGAVIAGRVEAPRFEGDGVDTTLVASQDVDALPELDAPFPHGPIGRGREETIAVHLIDSDPARMALEHVHTARDERWASDVFKGGGRRRAYNLPDCNEIILSEWSERPALSVLIPNKWLPLILKEVSDVSTFST